jgi:hypothetical protein
METSLQTIQGTCRRCGAQRDYEANLDLPVRVFEDEELDRNRLMLATDAAIPGEPSYA